MRSRPASSRAFSSACMHKQVARPTPALVPELQRAPCDVRIRRNTGAPGLKLTSALIAVHHISWGPVITGTDHSLLTNENAPNTSLHTVASPCS